MGQQQVDQQQFRVIALVVDSTFTSICDMVTILLLRLRPLIWKTNKSLLELFQMFDHLLALQKSPSKSVFLNIFIILTDSGGIYIISAATDINWQRKEIPRNGFCRTTYTEGYDK